MGRISATPAARRVCVDHLADVATSADGRVVRGRIAWDDETNGQQPMPVIDGEEYTWDDFGRMCMSYEGWQFKLEIRDPSEEV